MKGGHDGHGLKETPYGEMYGMNARARLLSKETSDVNSLANADNMNIGYTCRNVSVSRYQMGILHRLFLSLKI